ncbi:MAG TPA: DUF58 domain-containing protein [Solirubrobacteraceae bacterium]|nr:DUF58 domain-containing protein [Solirubrobacteraceae bacterium]
MSAPAGLQAPAARQGPGPIPRPLVDALDLAVNRLVARALPGDRRAAGVGLGTELAQLRPYEIGDDVRRIDPAATARTAVPHVRLHVPERAMTTWIALDVSPSMAFGTARRLKADVAEGVALVFGRLGIRRAGSVGMVSFGASAPHIVPPRGSKPGMVALRRTLGAGVAPDGEHDPNGLAGALRTLGRLATQPGLVVVVSDFREQSQWERPLGALRVHHAVLATEISDPRESELPAVGHLRLVDPETGSRVEVDTSLRRVRERFAELEQERRERIATELRRLRVDHVELSTDRDWLLDLGRRLRR